MYKRVIKFRGFSEVLNNWVYGLLIHHGDKTSLIRDDSGYEWSCLTSSVGQFTGARSLGKEGEETLTIVMMRNGLVVRLPKNSDPDNYGLKGKYNTFYQDNNGPDIYEGDIVTTKFTNNRKKKGKGLYTERVRSLVVFDNGDEHAWRLQRIENGLGYGSYYGGNLGWDPIIIGNSTEHPHLLRDPDSYNKHVGCVDAMGHLIGVNRGMSVNAGYLDPLPDISEA